MTPAINRFEKSKTSDMGPYQFFWIAFGKDIELNMPIKDPSQVKKELANTFTTIEKDVAYITVPLEEVDQMQAILDEKNLNIQVLPHSVSDRINLLVRTKFKLDL